MTADEGWSHFMTQSEYGASSIHLEDWPTTQPEWEDAAAMDAHAKVQRLQTLVSQVNVQLEKMRQAGEISLSLDAAAVVTADPQDPDFVLLTTCQAEMEDMWVLSSVTLVPQKGASLEIKAMKAPGVRCPRSWKYVPALVDAGRFGMVSPASREVLLAKYQNL
jgi:isoleucyl-tRNA synthetase